MIQLPDLFAVPPNSPLALELAHRRDIHSNIPDAYLLEGPDKCGKTTILFGIAASCASRGLPVTILCRRRKMDMQAPRLPLGMRQDDPALCNISIKYIESLANLHKWCACIHMHPPPLPTAVLLDDLHMYLHPEFPRPSERDGALAKTLAMLRDAVGYIASQGTPCSLVVSDSTTPANRAAPSVYARWLPSILHIRGNPTMYELQVRHRAHPMFESQHVCVEYHIDAGHVMADAVR